MNAYPPPRAAPFLRSLTPGILQLFGYSTPWWVEATSSELPGMTCGEFHLFAVCSLSESRGSLWSCVSSGETAASRRHVNLNPDFDRRVPPPRQLKS